MALRSRASGAGGRGADRASAEVALRDRLGAVAVLAGVGVFVTVFALAVRTPGTAYVWHLNMVSDLGDRSCHVRDARWICSPGHVLFNSGLILTGGLLAVAGSLLLRLWGRILAGSVVVMGVGLVVAGLFTATDHGAIHLVGVVLALVAPGLGLLWSAARPETGWLDSHRVVRGLLGGAALLLAAESRLPDAVLPRGAGELGIVFFLVSALVVEAMRLRPGGGAGGSQGPTSRSADGTAATPSASQSPVPRSAASADR
ncbi:hypothetical protein [Ornithinimicrobium pratense]|uniref:DUF998 domain-containing protein n=1 Tax=Ornithinimicrobium pratense TaxID=2593973 RepID=A0A5J6VA48_9MICO|nr:hypothetical protein [Ornithinimicrobium pratense]QFG69962.1 hypothetical protein FY030_15725 [Ornithinimicrobium pratense]